VRREQGDDKTAGVSNFQSATSYEIIDSVELAKRWVLPTSWIREQARSRATDPIPHIRFGRYVRFRWGSPELNDWLQRRMVNSGRRG
jgi:hypothetical protein